MTLTDAELKELSRMLDKRAGKTKRRPPMRTPPAKKARDPAEPSNVVPIRSCHSLPELRWTTYCGGAEVVDITNRLPPRRGRMNQARTKKGIGSLFEEFNERKGEVAQAEHETISAIISGHLHRSVMDKTRDRQSVECLFQEQWRILWNRWNNEQDTSGGVLS